MIQASRTFRIFVSSTFSDLKEERNALQERVFPKLRELCMQHGCRFQAIDLRWGVREEAGLDQQTMSICLQELKRCQKVTPRPNFIVLLGDRYGWQPLPPQIPANEFEEILTAVTKPGDRDFILCPEPPKHPPKGWYRKDLNAVPPEYCLRPRELDIPENATDQENKAIRARESKEWEQLENRMRAILLSAIDRLGWPPDDPRRIKYEASATHQEILAGALSPEVKDAHEHVFGFFRRITNLNELERDLDKPQADPDKEARNFVDHFLGPDGKKHIDRKAHGRLQCLKKQEFESALRANIDDYEVKWIESGITTDHIGTLPEKLDDCLKLNEDDRAPCSLCVDVWRRLSGVILKEIAKLKADDPLDKEIADHQRFGGDRAKFFTGRTAILQSIATYIRGPDRHPLAVFGESGSGKTALMARAIADCGLRGCSQADRRNAECEVVSRFIGATPSSSDGRSLLESLCRQISRRYGADEANVPTDYRELVQEFRERLALATEEKPLILFLDALDQLSDTDHARNLMWLPAELPDNVCLIVSILPGDCFSVLEKKLPEANLIELEPMPLNEGNELLDIWLKDAGRTLQDHQWDAVLDKFAQCGLPLYLKLAFEEARRWKSCTEKTRLSPDIPGIIRDLFMRLSSDTNHGKMMVSRSLGYLAAAKNGLTEDELLDVLSLDEEALQDFIQRAFHETPEKRLPVVVWSRLYFDLEPYLTERTADGTTLMTFYHRQLAEVVTEEFLSGEAKRKRHEGLAQYFRQQPLTLGPDDQKEPNLRIFSELPYHLAKAQMWPALIEVLTDIYWFAIAWDLDEYMLMEYWNQAHVLAKKDPLQISVDIPNLYRQAWSKIRGPEKHRALGRLGSFFRKLGFHDAAAQCFEEEVLHRDIYQDSPDSQDMIANLGDRGLLQLDLGNPQGASRLFKEAIRCLEKVKSPNSTTLKSLATSLMNQACALREQGELDACEPLLKRSIECMQKATGLESPEVATVLQQFGNLFSDQSKFDKAFRYHKKAYTIRTRFLGADHFDVGISLYNLAVSLFNRRQYYIADQHAKQAIEVLGRYLERGHDYIKKSENILENYCILVNKAISNSSGFGVLLFVFGIPQGEERGRKGTYRRQDADETASRLISQFLIQVWNDMMLHGSSLPILVIGFPGYEGSIDLALDLPISKEIPENLLQFVRIPYLAIEYSKPDIKIFGELSKQHSTLISWLNDHKIACLMVKPLVNIGAIVDRRFLLHCIEETRHLIFETVNPDESEGPIAGIFEGKSIFQPTDEWKKQNYSPRKGDMIATGTFYLNINRVRELAIGEGAADGNFLAKLHDRVALSLLRIASSSRENQLSAFENAYCNLTHVLDIGIIGDVPDERAVCFRNMSQHSDMLKDIT